MEEMMFDAQQPKMPIGENQEVEQQEIIPNYQSMGGQEIGKLMLDSSDLITKIRYQLAGCAKDENGSYKQVTEPLMNTKGIGSLIIMIESLAVKETYLTKIEDKDAVRITKDLWRTVIKLIVKNRIEWQIPNDPGKWSLIREILINPIFFALRRGVDATEKHFFADTHKSSTVSNSSSSQQYQKKGLFG